MSVVIPSESSGIFFISFTFFTLLRYFLIYPFEGNSSPIAWYSGMATSGLIVGSLGGLLSLDLAGAVDWSFS